MYRQPCGVSGCIVHSGDILGSSMLSWVNISVIWDVF